MESLAVFTPFSQRETPILRGQNYGKEKKKESRKDPKNGGDGRTKKMVDSALYHLLDLCRYSGNRGYSILTVYLTDSLRRGGSDITGSPSIPRA